MKAPPDVKTPEDYLKSAPPARQEILRTLHAAILEAAPHLKAKICYGNIGYGTGEYPKSGGEGDWCKVGLASQKNHIGLYICARDADGHLIEKNRDRLGKVSTGKACIRFIKLENLNLEVAMELVRQAAGAVANEGQ